MFLPCFCVLHMPGEACAGFQAVPRSSFCRWSFGRLGFLRGQDVCGTFQDFDGFLCIALYLDVFGSCQVFAEPIQHSCITHVLQGQLILFHSNSWEGSRSRKTVSGLSALRQTPFIHHWRCDTSCGHRKPRRVHLNTSYLIYLIVCCSFLYLCLLLCQSHLITAAHEHSSCFPPPCTGLAPLIEAISGISGREVDFGDFKQWASRQSTGVPKTVNP